jgi:hypothetical protein
LWTILSIHYDRRFAGWGHIVSWNIEIWDFIPLQFFEKLGRSKNLSATQYDVTSAHRESIYYGSH